MTDPEKPATSLNIRQAAFIGVGAMVGAGIFSLLGAAGEVAGAAVWLSFVLAGAVAGLQGYSFAKFGARYPSAGGLLEYVSRGFGDGHFTGIIAWLVLATNAIVTGMVAVSFGSYASSALNLDSEAAAKAFAVSHYSRHDPAEHTRLPGSGPDTNSHRIRGARHPHRLRHRHPDKPQPTFARLFWLSADSRHRVKRRAHVLRLSRLRHHHLHREGPAEPITSTAPGDVPGTRHCNGHLCCSLARSFRHPDGSDR